MKLLEVLKSNITPDQEIIERLMNILVSITLGELIAKSPVIQKLLFSPLPNQYADPVRESNERKKAEVEESKARKKPQKIVPVGASIYLVNTDVDLNTILKPGTRVSASDAKPTLVSSFRTAQEAFDEIYAVKRPYPHFRVGLKDIRVRALLDTGAEVNVVTKEITATAGLVIYKLPKELDNINMTRVTRGRAQFSSIILDAPIRFRNLTVKTTLLVVD